MVCPRIEGGGGVQPTGNVTFSGFQMSISPPLGLHYKSDSHPWGPQTLHTCSNFKKLIGTHSTLFQHSASPQSNCLETSGPHQLCANEEEIFYLLRYLAWF